MKKNNSTIPSNIKHNPVAKYMNIFNKHKVMKDKKNGYDRKHKHSKNYVEEE